MMVTMGHGPGAAGTAGRRRDGLARRKGGARSVAVGFLGVDPGRVLLQRLPAPLERPLRGRAAAGPEHVALPDPGEPLLQLVQVDLVLLQLREGVVAGHVLLLYLRQEVLTAVHDLLVLVVPGRLERRVHLLRPGQDGTREQHRRPAHVEDLAAQLAQRPLRAQARRQGRRGVLQVDRAQALQPPPHRRAEPARLGRHPVDQQQPALRGLLFTLGHSRIVADRRLGSVPPTPAPLLAAFGLQWLRKAILRASGYKDLHDEGAISARQVAAAQAATGGGRRGVRDWYAFTLSFKGVLLEGLEVVFIAITFGDNQGDLGVAAAAAAAAVLAVAATGIAVRAPLSRVPENTMKFAVGVMLTSFGVFWGAEGAGVSWPGNDAALLAVVPAVILVA